MKNEPPQLTEEQELQSNYNFWKGYIQEKKEDVIRAEGKLAEARKALRETMEKQKALSQAK